MASLDEQKLEQIRSEDERQTAAHIAEKMKLIAERSSLSVVAAFAVPANDLCEGALPLPLDGSVVTGNTTGATVDVSIGFCDTNLNTAPGVWYKFTSLQERTVTVSTDHDETDYDTKLGVFEGSCDALTCVGGNDDIFYPDNTKSRVRFCTKSNTDYYVYVTGFSTDSGQFGLNATPISYSNFPCENALDVTEHICGDAVIGNTLCAPTHNVPYCYTSLYTAPGLWYKLTLPADDPGATIVVDTCHPETNFDTKLGVFSGSCESLVCVIGNDDDFSCDLGTRRSCVEFPAKSGVPYWIYVTGFSTRAGSFGLNIRRKICPTSCPSTTLECDGRGALVQAEEWLAANPAEADCSECNSGQMCSLTQCFKDEFEPGRCNTGTLTRSTYLYEVKIGNPNVVAQYSSAQVALGPQGVAEFDVEGVPKCIPDGALGVLSGVFVTFEYQFQTSVNGVPIELTVCDVNDVELAVIGSPGDSCVLDQTVVLYSLADYNAAACDGVLRFRIKPNPDFAMGCDEQFVKATVRMPESATCVQTVSVVNTTAPVIECPPDVTVEYGDSLAPAVTGEACAKQGACCDRPPFITFTDKRTLENCKLFVDRTWKACDSFGNASTCVQRITVVDLSPPIIHCPPDVTVECGCCTEPSCTGEATCEPGCNLLESDECVVLPPRDEVVARYTCLDDAPRRILRTWTAKDACGNVASCVQTICIDGCYEQRKEKRFDPCEL